MCRSRAELDPVFRVVMFVINGSCPVAPCRWAPTVSGGSPAVRLSGLRWWRPSAGELRNVVEVVGFA
jgi:hypothetical protein